MVYSVSYNRIDTIVLVVELFGKTIDNTALYDACIVNSFPPGQNGRHFEDDILKCIFVKEEFCIFIEISLKFVPKVPIGNNSALV